MLPKACPCPVIVRGRCIEAGGRGKVGQLLHARHMTVDCATLQSAETTIRAGGAASGGAGVGAGSCSWDLVLWGEPEFTTISDVPCATFCLRRARKPSLGRTVRGYLVTCCRDTGAPDAEEQDGSSTPPSKRAKDDAVLVQPLPAQFGTMTGETYCCVGLWSL